MNTALKGIKVLDLTMNLPGPYMTWLMAAMGADVLKVENPLGGDLARVFTNPEVQLYFPVFDMVNRGKRSLSVDLKQSDGQEVFMKLLSEYDIVVEGFRPGVLKSLELDYETVNIRFPGVIYVSITGYGQSGRYAQRAGHDLNFQALAGSFDTGNGVRQLLSPPTVPIADLAGGGLFALSGLLAAVIERVRTGKGQHVDVSMLDGTFALNVLALNHMNAMSKQSLSTGHFLSGCQPFYNIYETSDGRQMAFGAVEPKFWRNFCKTVHRDDLLDKQFGGEAVTLEVAAIFKSRTQAQWIGLLTDVDACCEPVLSVDEVIDADLCQDRRLAHRDHREGVLMLNSPIKSVNEAPRAVTPAPALGQHNDGILNQL